MKTFRATNLLRETLANSTETANRQVSQIFAVVHVIESYLVSTPPELISFWGLAQVAAQLQAAYSHFDNFGTTRQLEQLETAVTVVSQHVQPLLWTFTRPSEEAAGAVYTQMLSEHHNIAKRSMDELSRKHDETKQLLEAEIEKVKELRSSIMLMSEDAGRVRSEASASVAQLQNQYHDEERDRKIEHEKAMQDRKDDASKSLETSKVDAERHLAILQNYETDAAKLFSALGHTGVTGNYQIVAKTETSRADWMRRGALFFFAVGVTMALGLVDKFLGHEHTPDNMIAILVRIGTAITITLPGWYLARESARHRTTADRARQTEMELASLGPFIELMEKNKKDAIREELIKKYFGNGVQEHTVTAPASLTEVTGFMEVLSKFRGGEGK